MVRESSISIITLPARAPKAKLIRIAESITARLHLNLNLIELNLKRVALFLSTGIGDEVQATIL